MAQCIILIVTFSPFLCYWALMIITSSYSYYLFPLLLVFISPCIISFYSLNIFLFIFPLNSVSPYSAAFYLSFPSWFIYSGRIISSVALISPLLPCFIHSLVYYISLLHFLLGRSLLQPLVSSLTHYQPSYTWIHHCVASVLAAFASSLSLPIQKPIQCRFSPSRYHPPFPSFLSPFFFTPLSFFLP